MIQSVLRAFREVCGELLAALRLLADPAAVPSPEDRLEVCILAKVRELIIYAGWSLNPGKVRNPRFDRR